MMSSEQGVLEDAEAAWAGPASLESSAEEVWRGRSCAPGSCAGLALCLAQPAELDREPTT